MNTPIHELPEKWREQSIAPKDDCLPTLYLRHAAELEAALANQWRPIETAPKDGTLVLLVQPWRRTAIGSYRIDQMAHDAGPTWLADDYDEYSTGYASTPLAPAYWMPLPAPPKGGEQ